MLASVELDELDADGLGAAGEQGLGLREGVGVDDEDVGARLRGTAGEEHALDDGGALVEHRRVGGGEPRQLGDHRLEVDERLEPALRDLGLVRRVGRVPARVLEHVALDHGGRDGVVVAEADHAARGAAAVGERAELGQRLLLADRRRQHRGVDGLGVDAVRHGGTDERLDAVVAEQLEHGRLVGGVVPTWRSTKPVAARSDQSPKTDPCASLIRR